MTATSTLPPLELDANDLGEVVREAHPANPKWYEIGLELGVDTYVLDGIKMACMGNPSHCFRDMLKEWLKGEGPHWHRLEEALRSPSVREYSLAGKLRRRYSSQSSDQSGTERDSPYSPQRSSSVTSSVTSTTQSRDMAPYGCGCGQCTFTTYVEVGCPDPKPSTSSFPFLNTEDLSPNEIHLLHGRLYEEYQLIVRRFSHLSITINKALIKLGVKVKNLYQILRELRAFQPASSDLPLLKERLPEIKKAEDVDEVFDILTEYMSFFSYQILEHIVAELDINALTDSQQDPGTVKETLKTELEMYQGYLMKYCKRNIFECPAYSPLKKGHATLVLKVDNEVIETGNMKHLAQLTTSVSRALSLSQHTLMLCNVEKGCVLLAYQLSRCVAQKLFPLTPSQEAGLCKEGVVKLSCDQWQYTLERKARAHLPLVESKSVDEIDSPVGPAPPIPPKKSPSKEQRASANAKQDAPPISTAPPEPPSVKGLMIHEDEILGRHPWYHGNITRRDAEERLMATTTDSFLVRRKEGLGVYALSEVYNKQCKHYIVKKSNGVYESLYELEHRSFNTIPEMVAYLEYRFFFQPCQKTVVPTNTVELLEGDWVVKTTAASVQSETDVPDWTGESGYGTGTGDTGFPMPLAVGGKRQKDDGKGAQYTKLRSDSLVKDSKYEKLRKGDDYKDYKDIFQIEERHPVREPPQDHVTEVPHPPPIYDRVFVDDY